MHRLSNTLSRALLVLLQIEPRKQFAAAILVLAFIVALNLSSNAIFALLPPGWGILAAFSPLIVAVLAGAWLTWSGWHLPPSSAPRLFGKPPVKPGLVLMLSTFYDRGDLKDTNEALRDAWDGDRLQQALSVPVIDWDVIRIRFERSNMEPMLQAMRYHRDHNTLRHVWLITTRDITTIDEQIVQKGSWRFAHNFRRVVCYIFGIADQTQEYAIDFHFEDEELQVAPNDVTPVYHAVEHIFTVAAPDVGLSPNAVIADMTGGRATMSAGMILACAPRGWDVQYTTTDLDPVVKGVRNRPSPVLLEIDVREQLLHAIEAKAAESESGSVAAKVNA